MEFNRLIWCFPLWSCSSWVIIFPTSWLIHNYFPSSSSFSDFDGFVQFIRHRSRDLPLGGSLLPHILLLLSPWWPERGIRGRGGGWGWQHRSRLQREKGAGHLLCHVGGGGSCHAVLVRKEDSYVIITYRNTYTSHEGAANDTHLIQKYNQQINILF